jgi:hypothetical protein
MGHDNTVDTEVVGWLETLGITTLCQWDLLIFLYRHQTSLFGADYLACLSGYATELVVSTMASLESLEVVGRSRISQGARYYQFVVPSSPPRREAFERLLELASHRAGRLRLSRQLRRNGCSPAEGLQAARRFLAEARRAARLRAQKDADRRKTWPKAI